MSDPGDKLVAGMLRHKASIEAARAIAARIAAEREALQQTAGLSATVPVDSSVVFSEGEQ